MNSIVQALAKWCDANSETLSEKGAKLTKKFPEENSEFSWKASIELTYKNIAISYAVWERTIFQTSLIIFNTSTKKTIIMDDHEPSSPEIVFQDMDGVIEKLLDNVYENMAPDPKLIMC